MRRDANVSVASAQEDQADTISLMVLLATCIRLIR